MLMYFWQPLKEYVYINKNNWLNWFKNKKKRCVKRCSFVYLQHVDGSFSVKPLKQKQIVGFYVIILLNYNRSTSQILKYCFYCSELVMRQDVLATLQWFESQLKYHSYPVSVLRWIVHIKFYCCCHPSDTTCQMMETGFFLIPWISVLTVCVSFQVDRVSYLLQEIYGIENKNNQETKVPVKISFYDS